MPSSSFTPVQKMLTALELVLAEGTVPGLLRHAAREALDLWAASLATDAQVAMVETSDDLEVDDEGACVSEGDGGFFIQTWTWVECDMSEAEDEDETDTTVGDST